MASVPVFGGVEVAAPDDDSLLREPVLIIGELD
jgi:hypothetical protein